MDDMFKIHKRKESGKYYTSYKGKKITMKLIPTMIRYLTMEVLNKLGECNGKIINNIPGRLIEFPTREDAEKAIDYLCAKMIIEKFSE